MKDAVTRKSPCKFRSLYEHVEGNTQTWRGKTPRDSMRKKPLENQTHKGTHAFLADMEYYDLALLLFTLLQL